MFITGIELVGPSKRHWAGNVMAIFLVTGELYLVLVVYLLRDWFYFTLVISAPALFFLPYVWYTTVL